MRKERLATAIVGAAHGLDGSVRVRSLSGDYGHLSKAHRLEARRGAVQRTLTIERLRLAGDVAVVKFREIADRNQAERLTGHELWVERDAAAVLEDDEYYVADLVDMQVVVSGQPVGRVRSVIDGAQGELLEVALADRQVLVPFRAEFVGSVNVIQGQLEITQPWILD